MPPDEQDLIDLLVADHRRLESLFAEIETSAEASARQAAITAAITLLDRHTRAEEALLHPALRERLPAGEAIVAYETGEHGRMDELLTRLGALDDTDPAFDGLLATLLDAVRQHMQEEETELFPRLRSARVTE
ncbi:hemerythrin domain-containing protein [Dactylosporangium roseum]|uniref:Hemerythrin domain-containing protein n=1 Tax=Dactylosporangium roseum TaxID=47989 RepID=A0ABY5Z3I4_9ACTN|nr:hemerythrin domain-containing protein [Dactylosporangium roseum]UWZ35427.1 hemerythrin domain-containing protein [Dactylosporangium roseum]